MCLNHTLIVIMYKYNHCKQKNSAKVNKIFYDVLCRIFTMIQLTDHKVRLR